MKRLSWRTTSRTRSKSHRQTDARAAIDVCFRWLPTLARGAREDLTPHTPAMSQASTPNCSPIERAASAWTALVSALLLGAIATPFFCDRLYTRDDLGAVHFPLRQFYASCVKQGANFSGWPGVLCG